MRNNGIRSYPASLLPGLLGLGIGVAITASWVGGGELAELYRDQPEFQLWRGVIIVQITVFIGVAAYLVDASGDQWLPRLTRSETGLIALMTVVAIGLPHVLFLIEEDLRPTLNWLGTPFLFAVTSGLVAMVLLTNRLGRIHAALAAAQDPDAYRQPRQATQDLLMIAAATITLGTLGTGILQRFLDTTPGASINPLTEEHVLAYGAYFTVVVLLFFAPIFAAERASAMRIRDRLAADTTTPVEESVLLNLETSLIQRLVKAFGVLSPLLGAIGSQLL